MLEYALSVDNLFVFLLVFTYFQVAPEIQHRVLFWGVLGAFVLRASLIVLGTALVARFQWLLYVFGAFLLYTAVKMPFSKEEDEVDPENSLILRWGRRGAAGGAPDTEGYHFFAARGRQAPVTPLFLVLVVVEATDLLFALDSIPAVLGISQDAVHRLHLQRLRHPRPALAVLRGRVADGQVPLPQGGAGRGAGLHRREDAGRRWST